MAFQASLTDPGTGDVDITFSSTGGTLTIEDHSNYTSASESGHDNADFSDYRKIRVKSPHDDYLFSSIEDDGDKEIDPGSSGTNIFTYSLPDGQKDGVYTIELFTVPTYDSSDSYQADNDYVYYDGDLYKCIKNASNKQPDTETDFWTKLSDKESLSSKYYITERGALTCDLQDCWQDLTAAAFCNADRNNCNRLDLFENKDFQDALITMMAKDVYDDLVDNNDWERVKQILNYTNTICGC